MGEFSWAYISGGAGDGPNGSVQFRENSSLSGTANFTYDSNIDSLALTGSAYVQGAISASANISASAFYGDASNLTNIPAGSPDGADTQIQFNNAGAFGASANLTYDGTDLFLTGSLRLTGSAQSLLVLDTRDADTLKEIVFNKDGAAAAAIQINSSEHLFIENENAKDIVLRANNQNTLRVIGAERKVIVGAVSKTSANAELDVEGSAIVSGSFVVSGSSTVGLNADHIATVGGQLTASLGIALGENSFVTTDKSVVFGSAADSAIQYSSGISKLIVSGSTTGVELMGGSISIDFPGGTVASGTLAGDGSYLGLDSSNNIVLTSSAGGGGGTPDGADTQIQFNNAGSFGGSANLTWDNTDEEFVLTGSVDVVSGSTKVFQVDSAADGSGSVRGRMLHITNHSFDYSGINLIYIPFVDLTEAMAAFANRRFVAPYNGRLVKVMFRPDLNQNNATGSIRLVHSSDLTQNPSNGTVAEIVSVPLFDNLYTTTVFNFTGSIAQHFSSGNAVGVGIDTGQNMGNTVVTCVWEFDQLT